MTQTAMTQTVARIPIPETATTPMTVATVKHRETEMVIPVTVTMATAEIPIPETRITPADSNPTDKMTTPLIRPHRLMMTMLRLPPKHLRRPSPRTQRQTTPVHPTTTKLADPRV